MSFRKKTVHYPVEKCAQSVSMLVVCERSNKLSQ